jgi:hypothetical protein
MIATAMLVVSASPSLRCIDCGVPVSTAPWLIALALLGVFLEDLDVKDWVHRIARAQAGQTGPAGRCMGAVTRSNQAPGQRSLEGRRFLNRID